MDPAPSLQDAEPHPDSTRARPPDEVGRADDALTRLVQEAAHPDASPRSAKPGSDFSAEPRIAAPEIEVAPRSLGSAPTVGAPPWPPESGGGRRTLVRFLGAAAVGVVATLAWQSYGGAARQMLATFVPALGGPASPRAPAAPAGAQPMSANDPSATVQPPGVGTALAPAAARAPGASVPASVSPEIAQDIKTMARDLAALRRSVEQLTASQEQMSGTIAKLGAAEETMEHRLATAPPVRKPVSRRSPPGPQVLAPGPRPLWQSFEPSPGPVPPQPRAPSSP